MRRAARRLLRTTALELAALASRAVDRLERLDGTPRVHILLLHEVLPVQEDAFRGLLRRLAQRFRFVPFGAAVTALRDGTVTEPLMAFTFDDGRRNNWEAAGILEEHGARACFYVCPDIVGVEDEARLAEFCRERLWMAPDRFLDWEQCRSLVARGHEIGGHTMTHPNLAAIAPDDAAEEIRLCREALLGQVGRAEHFAWPYGRARHMTPPLVEHVYRCGWTSCASGERGCHVLAAGASARAAVLRRESIQADWPWRHVAWFLGRAVVAARGGDDRPAATQVAA